MVQYTSLPTQKYMKFRPLYCTKEWCIPKADAEFVAKMEDVLEVYQRPYDPLNPVVCIDETNKQLIQETRVCPHTRIDRQKKES